MRDAGSGFRQARRRWRGPAHADLGRASLRIGKYFERGGDADVVLSRDGHGFRIECLVTLASGQQLQSHGLGADAHAAFGQALAKIETRIRRYKRRLKSHAIAAEAKAPGLARPTCCARRTERIRRR